MPTTAQIIEYRLEQLFVDQDRRFVLDTIPAVLAWVPTSARKKIGEPPFAFSVDFAASTGGAAERIELRLTWEIADLVRHDPTVQERSANMSAGAHREHLTETAAYGLALVAISALLPGRRVVAFNFYAAPDLLFDATPDAFRGVEVSGRSTGGRAALFAVRDGSYDTPGKAIHLPAAPGVVEAYLSLWCARPRVGEFRKVKP